MSHHIFRKILVNFGNHIDGFKGVGTVATNFMLLFSQTDLYGRRKYLPKMCKKDDSNPFLRPLCDDIF